MKSTVFKFGGIKVRRINKNLFETKTGSVLTLEETMALITKSGNNEHF